jgi:M3 family oligoendopeptidase
MQDGPRFSDLPFTTPNTSELSRQSEDLLSAWEAAGDASAQLAVIESWDREEAQFYTLRSLASIHFAQDATSASAKETKATFDRMAPEAQEHRLRFLKAVIESPHRSALETRLGQHALALWQLEQVVYEPVIAEDRRHEAELETRYDELRARVRIEYGGTEYTLSTIRALFGNPDRQVRLGAQRAQDAALGREVGALDEIYGELVGVRHRMARALGHESFIPLAYARMGRTDWGPTEAAAFRRQVEEVVVPLTTRARERQARALGVTDYGFHDESVRDKLGVPHPAGDHDWMVERAQEMFDTLGEDFGSFFRMLRQRDLLDLKSRDGKVGGGFCDFLGRDGIPFIFANFNGTQDDVTVFTHEIGHAFQSYTASAHPLSDYVWPTAEAGEIHSMSFEFLTWPFMESFFGEQADRFRQGHLESSLLFLPYGTAVDEFQHLVFSDPDATAARRAEMWQEVERRYLPTRRYDNMPTYESGRFWQRQSHIYTDPFYYLDYCLALVCSFQLWDLAERDREAALVLYRRLCTIGGSLSFTEILAEAGLRSPFDPGVLEEVLAPVAASLELATGN